MIRMFERIALVTAAGLVSSLIVAAALNPPVKITAAPKAVLKLTPVKVAAAVAAVVLTPELGLQRFLPIKARNSETLLASVNVRAYQLHKPAPVNSADHLDKTFSELGYDLERVREGAAQVPRVFLASMPGDLGQVREVRRKKALFFRAALPLILQVNDEILEDRKRLWKLHSQLQKGETLAAADRLWLIVMAERYKVKRDDISELLKRADIIPVSLALAQAAEESGWGTSRFTREGNAIFGQWTSDGSVGMVPKDRDEGKSHKVKSFASLLQSARAYARNLNTHRAYRELRSLRQEIRQQGEALKGYRLVETLSSYSERGDDYVKTLRSIIAVNKLRMLDEAELSTGA